MILTHAHTHAHARTREKKKRKKDALINVIQRRRENKLSALWVVERGERSGAHGRRWAFHCRPTSPGQAWLLFLVLPQASRYQSWHKEEDEGGEDDEEADEGEGEDEDEDEEEGKGDEEEEKGDDNVGKKHFRDVRFESEKTMVFFCHL